MPEVLIDNTQAIKDALDMAGLSPGCATAEPHRRATAAPYFGLCAVVLALLLCRRTRRVS